MVQGDTSRRQSAPSSRATAPTMGDSVLGSPGASDRRGERAEPSWGEGQRIGRYVVLSRVGEGGMGVVYAAYDPELDRKVALKVLRRRAGSVDDETHGRLIREARAMARLSDPNVVAVLDVGTVEGRLFLAMELCEGRTLADWLHERPRAWQEVVSVYVAAGRGLAAAHRSGLLHRDFKPHNVMVDAEDGGGARGFGRVRVMDFGLARSRDQPTAPAQTAAVRTEPTHSDTWSDKLTRTGSRVGTPAYMAPEQHLGLPIDERADQFAFCVALYAGLYGERPFAGRTLAELAFEVTQGAVRTPPPDRPVPMWLRRVVLRGISAQPAARWPSMAALLDQLERNPSAHWRRRIGFASLVLASTALGAYALADRSQRCGAGPDRVAKLWDETRRNAIRDAFRATSVGHAAETWVAVERMLDDYSRDWLGTYGELCETDAGSDPGFDRRMACLGRRLEDVGALLAVLEDADPRLVAQAPTAVADLEPVRSCEDPVSGSDSRPRDPAVAAAHDEVRRGLTELSALDRAGRYPAAAAASVPLLEAARALDDDALLAEVLHQKGALASKTSDFASARSDLGEAFWTARAAGHDLWTLRSAIALIGTVASGFGDHASATDWARHAGAALERVGDPPAERARLLNSLANLANEAGRYGDALGLYERAQAIAEDVHGPDHPRVALILHNIGLVLGKLGRPMEERQRHEQALRIYERTYGPHHPKVGLAHSRLGSALRSEGDLDGARHKLEYALDILVASVGPRHQDVAACRVNLANVLDDQGERAAARDHYRQALEVLEQVHGPDHPDVGDVLNNLATLAFLDGDLDGAEQGYARAVAIRERAFGRDHPIVAVSLNNLGLVAAGREHAARALELYRRALDIRQRTLGDDHPAVATSLQSIGIVMHERREYRSARRMFARAHAIRQRTLGDEHPETLRAQSWLGVALVESGELERGISLLEHSLDARVRHGYDAAGIALARFDLARALRSAGREPQRRVALAREARATFVETADERRVVEIDTWLADSAE